MRLQGNFDRVLQIVVGNLHFLTKDMEETLYLFSILPSLDRVQERVAHGCDEIHSFAPKLQMNAPIITVISS